VPPAIYTHTFANGLTLLAERMDHVRSAAFNFMLPAGFVYEPPAHRGVASVLMELLTRGAGDRDSRQLSLALDSLGLDHGESVGPLHAYLSGATLARNLPAVLDLYHDILRKPHLPEDEVDSVKDLLLLDLQGLEDDPQEKVMVELYERHYPNPLGADRRGTPETVASIKHKLVNDHYRRYFQPRNAIVSVAGNIEWEPLRDQIARLFGDWTPGEPPSLKLGATGAKLTHLPKEQTQTLIAMACPSVPFGHPDYYAAMGAVNVLGGGMSSRLFTEVREKRGLSYSVGATYRTFKDRATILAYAGSKSERAQETLDVMWAELQRLVQGIDAEELHRVKVGLKTSLVMQQESSRSRAGSLTGDWYYLGRIRNLDEIQAAVEQLTAESIVNYLQRHPLRDFTVVTLGPQELTMPA